MCGGVKYTDKTGKGWAIYFPSPKAALPVLKRDGDIEWVTWGKRKEVDDRFFAPGGWARIDSIQEGKWQRFQPRPVLLPVQSFMEKDHEKKSHWFDVPSGQAIQGLLAIQNQWKLLTSDRRMKNLAITEKVDSYGTLWIIDRLVEHGVKSGAEIVEVLEGMLDDPKNWIPKVEIKKRIALLKGTDA